MLNRKSQTPRFDDGATQRDQWEAFVIQSTLDEVAVRGGS